MDARGSNFLTENVTARNREYQCFSVGWKKSCLVRLGTGRNYYRLSEGIPDLNENSIERPG